MWTKDPDSYSGGVTNAAYVIMKRAYAPADRSAEGAHRARDRRMPAALAEARKNLDNPPQIYTEIAIEQIDGNISFFKNDVPAAFKDVTDPALLAEFKKANDGVIAALGEYKTFLKNDLLPKSKGSFAYGAETYAKALAANEMVDLPLDRLLQIAEADRQKNEEAFQATAKLDRSEEARRRGARVAAARPPGRGQAARRPRRATLDSLRQFIVDSPHHHDSAVGSRARARRRRRSCARRRPRRWTRPDRSRRRSSAASTT